MSLINIAVSAQAYTYMYLLLVSWVTLSHIYTPYIVHAEIYMYTVGQTLKIPS